MVLTLKVSIPGRGTAPVEMSVWLSQSMAAIVIITTGPAQRSRTWCGIRDIPTDIPTGGWWLFMTVKDTRCRLRNLTKELTMQGAIWRGQRPFTRHRVKPRDAG